VSEGKSWIAKTQRGASFAPHAELDITFTFACDILPIAAFIGALLIVWSRCGA
jgi:hypothetical protein